MKAVLGNIKFLWKEVRTKNQIVVWTFLLVVVVFLPEYNVLINTVLKYYYLFNMNSVTKNKNNNNKKPFPLEKIIIWERKMLRQRYKSPVKKLFFCFKIKSHV